jgi:holo-[acyl-carrier protein] synthase
MSTATGVRVGVDMATAREVADSLATFGDHYLRRVYTDHEIACCTGSPSVIAAGLAARFAAKEATIKVLRPTGHTPAWKSMEVQRHPGGWCTMSLSGHAAALSREAGITEMAVSLTHEGGMAAAVVVALSSGSAGDSSLQPGSQLSDPLSSGAR